MTNRFRLGPVNVDPEIGKISGPGGEQKLDPKVMAVLLRLAREPGQVIRRDSLMKDVWGDRVVTDVALSRCIYQLRKRLSAVARTEETAIETMPKRGYRLCWRIQPAEQAIRSRTDGQGSEVDLTPSHEEPVAPCSPVAGRRVLVAECR